MTKKRNWKQDKLREYLILKNKEGVVSDIVDYAEWIYRNNKNLKCFITLSEYLGIPLTRESIYNWFERYRKDRLVTRIKEGNRRGLNLTKIQDILKKELDEL